MHVVQCIMTAQHTAACSTCMRIATAGKCMLRSWAMVRRAALGFFIAAFSPNMDLAAVVVSSLVSCLCYSTGNLIRVVDMPPYWRWFTHINFL